MVMDGDDKPGVDLVAEDVQTVLLQFTSIRVSDVASACPNPASPRNSTKSPLT